jgi:hypothetical protein
MSLRPGRGFTPLRLPESNCRCLQPIFAENGKELLYRYPDYQDSLMWVSRTRISPRPIRWLICDISLVSLILHFPRPNLSIAFPKDHPSRLRASFVASEELLTPPPLLSWHLSALTPTLLGPCSLPPIAGLTAGSAALGHLGPCQ